MNDPLISLFQIAGLTLLVTILWALTLGASYWDIQRRRQAGARINGTAWMVVVALLPFLGLLVYLAARLLAPAPRPESRGSRHEPQRIDHPMATPAHGRVHARNPALIKEDSHPHIETQAQPGRPATVPFRFLVTSGPDQGKSFLIERFPAQIGRGLDSMIRLEDDTGVSRRHALVYQNKGVLHIRDLKSTHGTRVNGKRVRDHVLRPGDRIEVGLTYLTCQREEG
jgi:hypothetical protein